MKKRENTRGGIDPLKITALFLFLFVGPLIIFKPAYDYTVVKNLTGWLFCILLSVVFLFQKKNFVFEIRNFAVFLAFAFWVLLLALNARYGTGAARALEDYLLYFLIFTFAMNIRLSRGETYLWLASGFIATLTALFNFLGPRRYVVSTFGNPNFYAGHIMMLMAVAFSFLFVKESDRKEKYFLTAFIVFAFLSILATRSRAAAFGSVFGIATVAFLLYGRGSLLKKWSGYAVILIAGLAGYTRIAHWIATNIRMYIWKGTLRMISAKPFTGWGPGNFPFIYPYYRIREYFLQLTKTPVTIQSHNEYLQLLAETGIVGLALFLGLIVIIIFGVLKKINLNDSPLTQSPPPSSSPLKGEESRKKTQKKDTSNWEGIFIRGCIGAMAAVLVDNIFSTNLRNPSTAMYFWFLAGTCAGYAGKKEINFKASKYLWYAAAFAAFVMFVFTSFYRITPDIYLKRGIWAKEAHRLNEAISNYHIVCSINPHNYEAFYKMAFAYGESGRLKESEKIYLYINKNIFPHFAETDKNLGTVYLRLGDYRKALYYYKWAEWLNPYDIDVLCGTASMYIMFYNDPRQAVGYLDRVLTIDPKNGYANTVLALLKKEGKI